MAEEKIYTILNFGDQLTTGREIKINHHIYCDFSTEHFSPLISQPVDILQKMRDDSAEQETSIFIKLQKATDEWAERAAQTQLIDKAIEYVITPAVKHTSNEWIKDEYGNYSKSNMVYCMNYEIREVPRYDRMLKKSTPIAWIVSWDVNVQNPGKIYHPTQIAGQKNKEFDNKESLEKYLQGRIKAYTHLFTEISPAIPKIYKKFFCVNDQLLPGYSLQTEQEISAVHDRSNDLSDKQSSSKAHNHHQRRDKSR